ncbi:MAG: M23 family metallopeptidase [Pseudomonadota bacterium]
MLTYGALGVALIALWTQVASPRQAGAISHAVEHDPAGLLPPLPASTALDQIRPSAALFEITLAYPSDGDVSGLLIRAGAAADQARQASRMVRDRFGGEVDDASDIKLALGAQDEGKGRSIEQLTILNDLGRTIIARDGAAMRLVHGAPRAIKIDVPAGSVDAHRSLRDAGLDARLALEASALLKRRAAEARRVTAVIGERPDRFRDHGSPQLLYLAATREGRSPVRLLRWQGAPDGWIDIGKYSSDSGFMQPVQGRVSSGFGTRLHPILRFLRLHQGVDFAAGWGTPVRAAADGRVIGAGWSGGYGRQVRLDHGNGVVTSYSHLSDMVGVLGNSVRRGQIVGYVGASGLATGPHLHFEVIRMGRRIDPLSARFIEGNAVDRAKVAARLAQLRITGS